jgi:hypothetical protein
MKLNSAREHDLRVVAAASHSIFTITKLDLSYRGAPQLCEALIALEPYFRLAITTKVNIVVVLGSKSSLGTQQAANWFVISWPILIGVKMKVIAVGQFGESVGGELSCRREPHSLTGGQLLSMQEESLRMDQS